MKWLFLRTWPRAGVLSGLLLAAALSPGLAASANAREPQAAITASFDQSTGVLTVSGDKQSNTIAVGRDTAGAILVNDGAVPVQGGIPTVTNTRLIEVFGLGQDDQLALDESNGPLPGARLWGGAGNDRLSGGAGDDQLSGDAGDDILLGMAGVDRLSGGAGDDHLTGGAGQDKLLGGARNDTIVWVPGDDSDRIEGGAGDDSVIVTGGDNDDAFAATGNGMRVRFQQSGPNPSTLDIGAVERLVLNAGSGNDSFSSGPDLAPLIAIVVDGGAGEDTIAVAGSDESEMSTVTADNRRVRVERSYPSPFTLDIDAAETLALTTNGGDDRVAVGAAVDQVIKVSVDGSAMAAGDAIIEGDLTSAALSPNAGISATFSPSSGILTVFGNALDNAITISRDAAGAMLVNGGTVKILGGTPTVANTSLIQAFGQGGNDTIGLDEAGGALPRANLFGGAGTDSLTGGSGADQVFGQSGSDTLLGKGGVDLLFGGADNDVLAGGDGDDQAFGESGNDRMVWNPGDDTDLNEGGDGNDTVEVNGGNGAEVFTTTANGTRVRFDRIDPAPFFLDIGTTESLVLNANGGDDAFSATGNLAALIQISIDGGAGNDTLLGSNGIDLLLGGDGNDLIDGQQGNDTAMLGAGDDTFQWDPGDGSDVVEGQAGADSMLFNGSSGSENFAVSANGQRVRFTRNLGTIAMDINEIERFVLNAFGGTDVLTVDHLAGTSLGELNVNLAGTLGGSAGDTQPDTVIVNGTGGNDIIDIFGSGSSASVVGLPTLVTIANAEGANDSLVVNALDGDDGVTASTLPAGIVRLTIDGGAGIDRLLGSQGADVFLAGDGNDVIFGDNGNDLALMGAGDDTFQWDPGDGNDTLEGQAGADAMLFFGSNANENIDIVANGGRVLFFRDIAAVTMDLDDVERIEFRALGGADTIVVGDLSGTDLTRNDLDLRGPNGGGDGQTDSIVVNATQGNDVFGAAGDAGGVSIFGLPAVTNIFFQEQASDRLTLNGLGGNDTIDAASLEADGIQLTINGGLGVDTISGSQGNDLISGGDGDDQVLMGDGDDSFVWNPGDDNDTLEGQAGFDSMLFNGANIGENIDISATGERVRFFRDVASVTMDLNDIETVGYNALGGADTIVVNDMSGTDLTAVNLNLAAFGGAGDAQPDTVIVNGTGGDDVILAYGDTNGTTALGLAAVVNITGAETATDRLTINALAGDDAVDASGLAIGAIQLTANGGDGNDVLIGGDNNDTLTGGDGDDVLLGGPGVDVLDGGLGDNVIIQD